MGGTAEDAKAPNAVGSGHVYPPEMKARFRAELIALPNPRRVGRKLGIPSSTAYVWRRELLEDPTFVAEMDAFTTGLQSIAMAEAATGIEVASRIARDRTVNPQHRVAACKVLTSAPGDLARARSELTVKLTGSVALDDIDDLRKRLEGSGDPPEAPDHKPEAAGGPSPAPRASL